jgi:hypothetical protein
MQTVEQQQRNGVFYAVRAPGGYKLDKFRV